MRIECVLKQVRENYSMNSKDRITNNNKVLYLWKRLRQKSEVRKFVFKLPFIFAKSQNGGFQDAQRSGSCRYSRMFTGLWCKYDLCTCHYIFNVYMPYFINVPNRHDFAFIFFVVFLNEHDKLSTI